MRHIHACVLGIAAALLVLGGCEVRSAAECTLTGRAMVVSKATRAGLDVGWSADQLAIRNDDAEDWKDATITISGFEVVGTTGRKRTGPYTRQTTVVAARALQSMSLSDFQQAAGPRWVPTTMHIEDVAVSATVPSGTCTSDLQVTGG